MSEPRLSREEIANLEVGHTDISRGTALTIVALFLAFIVVLPFIQLGLDVKNAKDHGGVQTFEVAAIPAKALKAFKNGAPIDDPAVNAAGLLKRFNAANTQTLKSIDAYETDLKDNSFLTQALVSPMQAFNTRFLGQGNDLAYIGRDGWLFFRPGVNYVTGPGFLDDDRLLKRSRGGAAWEDAPTPDPRPAILELHSYLQAQGVQLILMPAPVKAMLHPEHLSSRYTAGGPVLQNPSWNAFVSEMSEAGVTLVDPSTAMQTVSNMFLKTDTHWTPEAMLAATKALADITRDTLQLSAPTTPPWSTRAVEVTNLGDIAANSLQLADAGIFQAETVTIQQLIDPPDLTKDAEIVFLGDSFANIYSVDKGLAWGDDAGLAHQLANELGQPLLAFTQNDNAAFATRQMLFSHALKQGSGFWKNKKVVIWEFAIRELAVGNWKPIQWDLIPDRGAVSTHPVAAATGSQTITGTIRKLSRPPKPGSVPYRDCIVQLYLEGVQGDGIDSKVALIRLFGMQDNKWTDATKFEPGQQVTLEVTDWASTAKARQLATLRVEEAELSVDELLEDAPNFWTDLATP